jgi:hypothetical protein
MSSTGVFKIIRKPNYDYPIAHVIQLDVLLDGEKIGITTKGKIVEDFDTATGRHTLQVKKSGSWGVRSNILEIEIEPNSSLELEFEISPLFLKRRRVFGYLFIFVAYVFLSWIFHSIDSTIARLGLVIGVALLYSFVRYGGACGEAYCLKRLDTSRPAQSAAP